MVVKLVVRTVVTSAEQMAVLSAAWTVEQKVVETVASMVLLWVDDSAESMEVTVVDEWAA